MDVIIPIGLAIVLAAGGCSTAPEPLGPHSATDPTIRQLDVGSGTNAFVIMGARPILVDTGWGDSTDQLENQLAKLGVHPHHLALIVLTHGHGDHAGGASRMRQLSGAKVLAHQQDVDMLRAGHNRPLKPMSFLGRLLRGYSDKPFPPLLPDLTIASELDLQPFGVDGKIVPVPGHTPGSVAVVLASGDAIVGDMVRGQLLRPHAPARHFFHDDCRAAEAHVNRLVQAGSRRFFVGHGGPLDAREARDCLRADPCP